MDSRLAALLAPGVQPGDRDVQGGYVDLLADRAPPAPGIAQQLMLSSALPQIYERWWRPFLGQVAKGAGGPSMKDEYRIAVEMLGSAGTVLDLACGTGNFTRRFARSADYVVGVDASATMLARAAGERTVANVTYVRADAAALPFASEAFDGVCCFAALNLFGEPWRAIEEMLRVLAPGGRIALFTSARRPDPVLGTWDRLLGLLSGMTIFGREELTGALAGLEDVNRRIAGVTQFVGARKPTR